MEATQSHILNLAILNKEVEKEAWYGTFWSRFAGFAKASTETDANQQKRILPSGKPITMSKQFIQEGRDNMLIPFELPLVGAPVFGDTVAKGTGEKMRFWYTRTYVNQVRKVVEPLSGEMSNQRIKFLDVAKRAKPSLSDWWAKWYNHEVSRAFYEGVSDNLSRGTSVDGLGLVRRYHPNFFYNLGGTLTEAGTPGKNKGAGDLNAAQGATDTGMSAAILRDYRVQMLKLKIPKIVTKKGYKFWALLVHPAQRETLVSDSSYTAAAQAYYQRFAEDNPQFSDAVAYWADFAIFEDIAAIRGWDDATGRFFGDDDSTPIESFFDPTTVTDNYCAIAFGNNCMSKGVAMPLNMVPDDDDFENVKEVAGRSLYGFSRNDFVSSDNAAETSGYAFEKGGSGGVMSEKTITNQSSAILMTKD